ncbi:hypothetical protein [Shimia abyssi]|uniref:tRNA A-37 threonylcarbamoyl transferase component Bud32 n=1 Tax=Shimia abyssi TaxID=1662395 RepID=A0A2P8F8I0_9RHOB|nr:hypothetical protein [Shimia abyssi]PSL18036.1 tRNA A-37 threonylcarbamoyl transferase component Bud32 [Shimia abyssi]
MDYRPPISVEEELRMLAESHTAKAPPRIERVEIKDCVFWIKRPERLNLRYRLQKGDPRAAFERERMAFHEMNAARAPVPELCAEGEDFIVLPDCGKDLRYLLHVEESDTARRELLLESARTLGRFHGLGFSHGRPSPKDMCLSDSGVVMLDFERYRHKNNTPKGQARDLVVFAFNVIAHSPRAKGFLKDAVAAYREVAPSGTWELAQDWCSKMRWAEWFAKPAQWRKGGHGREFKAVPDLFDLFLQRA